MKRKTSLKNRVNIEKPAPGELAPRKKPAIEWFGFEKVCYSIAGVLIFLSGIYFGSNYVPALETPDFQNNEKKLQVKSESNPNLRTSTLSFSQPEDFFPAAEFRNQSAIILGCRDQLYRMPKLYAEIARAVEQKVPLFGIVSNEFEAQFGADLIKESGLPPSAMRFLVLPSSSIWIRDYAPFILRYDDARSILVDAKYNTRGGHTSRKNDDFMGLEFARILGLPVRSIPLILEGGNFISNGDGILLTSPKTLTINKTNGTFTDQQMMGMFNDYLGVDGVFAVGPLQGEPNGHIDMFMTMPQKNVAIIGQINPSDDPENSDRLDKAAKFVSTITTSSGPIKVKRIPMPSKWGDDWRSYTNVIYANGNLLMPSFSDVDPILEDRAVAVFKENLPNGWKVKKIDCDHLVSLHGQLHCISYNIPEFVDIQSLNDLAIPKVTPKL